MLMYSGRVMGCWYKDAGSVRLRAECQDQVGCRRAVGLRTVLNAPTIKKMSPGTIQMENLSTDWQHDLYRNRNDCVSAAFGI